MGFLDPEKFARIVESVHEKTEKAPAPKDTSLFQGKPYLKRGDIKNWLKKDEVWKITKKPQQQRVALESKLFLRKEVGENVDPKEAEKIYQKLKDRPKESEKKYGIKIGAERNKTLDLLKKFLGK